MAQTESKKSGTPLSSAQQTMNYQNNGNITQKSDMGSYEYNVSQPHAVSGVNNLIGSSLPQAHSITYNAAQQPTNISYEVEAGDPTYSYNLIYGSDDQRRKTVLNNNGTSTWTVYTGLYEKRSDGKQLNYIQTPAGIKGVYITGDTFEDWGDYMNYFITDHLGSIIGKLPQGHEYNLQKCSFDPWGRKRNPDNWNDYSVSEDRYSTRGFTGHEHLDKFGLINMNGRLYDPELGRFLSPDNYIQSPGFTQSYNRYGYCWNNPLQYTDPDGEWVHILVGAIIGSTLGTGLSVYNSIKDGDGAWVTFRDGFIAGHIGGAAGALGALTGGAVGGGFWGATLGGATAGGFNATATTAYNGGSASEIMAANFWGSNIGGLSGAATYGVMAGVGAISNIGWSDLGGKLGPRPETAHTYNTMTVGKWVGLQTGGISTKIGNFFSGNASTIVGSTPTIVNGWTKTAGGWSKTKGMEQMYQVTHGGRQIPSFRAANMSQQSFNRSFRHNVNPAATGPYVSSNQINFNQNVNNITVTPGFPFRKGNVFTAWSGETTIANPYGSTGSPSGNSMGWYSHGFILNPQDVFFFTLSIFK